jgi:hypothetical protein
MYVLIVPPGECDSSGLAQHDGDCHVSETWRAFVVAVFCEAYGRSVLDISPRADCRSQWELGPQTEPRRRATKVVPTRFCFCMKGIVLVPCS